MLKARTGFDSRLLTWSRIGMGCSKSDLSGGRGPLPPLPLLTKEGSEKRQKLPTRFGEEPKKPWVQFKNFQSCVPCRIMSIEIARELLLR